MQRAPPSRPLSVTSKVEVLERWCSPREDVSFIQASQALPDEEKWFPNVIAFGDYLSEHLPITASSKKLRAQRSSRRRPT